MLIRIRKLVNLLLTTVVLTVNTACDYVSTVHYTVENHSDSIVSIKMKPGTDFYISGNSEYNPQDSTIVLLKRDGSLVRFLEWFHGTPDPHTPLWDDIVSIHIGKTELPPERWNHYEAWIAIYEDKGLGSWDYFLEINVFN